MVNVISAPPLSRGTWDCIETFGRDLLIVKFIKESEQRHK